jgi:hypothetical protein
MRSLSCSKYTEFACLLLPPLLLMLLLPPLLPLLLLLLLAVMLLAVMLLQVFWRVICICITEGLPTTCGM